MSAWLIIPAFMFGLGIGGMIEHHRWREWARREGIQDAEQESA